MSVVIEQNVEKPKDELFAALEKMEVGDSFPFDRKDRSRLAVHITEKYHNVGEKRFTISVKNQPAGKARCWRDEDDVTKMTA